MPENVTINPTTTSGGAVIHTDELSSGAQVQRIKIGTGNPGVYTDVSSSNPFPITGDVSVGNTVTVAGTVTATPSGVQDVSVGNTVAVSNAGLTELAAAINSNELDVNLASSNATVTVTGTVTATPSGTQAVSDGAVVSALGGTLSVDLGSNNDVTIEGGAVLGTTGNAGPANALSIGGTESGGTFREIAVDSSGNVQVDIVSGSSSGTEYSVGTALADEAGNGPLILAKRDDALGGLTEVEGTVVPMRVDANGALWVVSSPGDAETTDGATVHSLGVTRQVNVGFVSEPNELSVGANTVGMAGMNSERALYVSIREDSVGIGGGTQYSEGTAVGDTSGTGNLLLAKRDDALGGLAESAGQVVGLRVDANGALWTQHNGTMVVSDGAVVAALGGTLTVDNGGTFAVQAAQSGDWGVSVGNTVTVTGSVTADLGSNNDIQGQGAHDAAVTGNPVVTGARATNSVEGITQVANADAVRTAADLNGVTLTRPHTTLEEVLSERVANTNGTSTNFSTFGAGGAGVHNYVTTISIYNSSATDGYVDFRDGSAGSVIFTAAAPAAGGSVINLPVPLKGAANTALAYDVSGALDTVYISVVGFQAQG
jgi:fibronectin-binding autotransporter adhesin